MSIGPPDLSTPLAPADTGARLLAGRYLLGQISEPDAHPVRAHDDSRDEQVWVAHDILLDRPVAVRLLMTDASQNPDRVARFRATARSAARVSHPTIASVYDTVSEDGAEALVYEIVSGTSLGDHVRRHGPLDPAGAAAVGMQLAEVLEAVGESTTSPAIDSDNVVLGSDGRVRLRGIATEAIRGPSRQVRALAHLLGECLVGEPIDAEGSPTRSSSANRARTPGAAGRASPLERSLAPKARELLLAGLAPGDDAPFESAAELARSFAEAVSLEPAPLVINLTNRPRTVGSATIKPGEPAPPVRMPPPPEPRRTRSFRPIPMVIAALVLIAIAVLALRPDRPEPALIDQGTSTAVAGPADAIPTRAGPAAPLPAPTSEPATAAVTVQLPALATSALARSFDPPPGDGAEHPELVASAVDGDPSTEWRTETYTNRRFGDLKTGVGLVLELEDARILERLTVHSPVDDWSAQIHLTTGDPDVTSDWGEPIDARSGLNGSVTFDLRKVRAGAVLIWITDLGPAAQFAISELELS